MVQTMSSRQWDSGNLERADRRKADGKCEKHSERLLETIAGRGEESDGVYLQLTLGLCLLALPPLVPHQGQQTSH